MEARAPKRVGFGAAKNNYSNQKELPYVAKKEKLKTKDDADGLTLLPKVADLLKARLRLGNRGSKGVVTGIEPEDVGVALLVGPQSGAPKEKSLKVGGEEALRDEYCDHRKGRRGGNFLRVMWEKEKGKLLSKNPPLCPKWR